MTTHTCVGLRDTQTYVGLRDTQTYLGLRDTQTYVGLRTCIYLQLIQQSMNTHSLSILTHTSTTHGYSYTNFYYTRVYICNNL